MQLVSRETSAHSSLTNRTARLKTTRCIIYYSIQLFQCLVYLARAELGWDGVLHYNRSQFRRRGGGWGDGDEPSSLFIQLLMLCRISWLHPFCLRERVCLPANQGKNAIFLLWRKIVVFTLEKLCSALQEGAELILLLRFFSGVKWKQMCIKRLLLPRDLSGHVAPSVSTLIARAPRGKRFNRLQPLQEHPTPPPAAYRNASMGLTHTRLCEFFLQSFLATEWKSEW